MLAGYQKNLRYSTLEKAQLYHDKVTTTSPQKWLSQRLELWMLQRALERVDGGCRVLDAPCGTGRIDSILTKKFSQVIGLDASSSMLSVYLHGNPKRQAILADIFDPPFTENHFDWVVCHRFFHHLKNDTDRIRLLQGFKKISRQGVVFYAWTKTPFRKKVSSRRQTLSVSHVKDLIRQAGLTPLATHYACWPLQNKTIFVCRTS